MSSDESDAYGAWLLGLQVQGWPMWRLAAKEER